MMITLRSLGSPCPLAVLMSPPRVTLLSLFHIVGFTFFSGLPLIPASPEPWGFYCHLGFIFSASRNGPSRPACWESDLATHCLALGVFWDLGISFHGPPTTTLVSFMPVKQVLCELPAKFCCQLEM